jgi:hypothetical protein
MWKAEFLNPGNCRLYRGEAIIAHVVEGNEGWRVIPNVAGRRSSKRAYVGCAVAAMTYFPKHEKEIQAAILAARDTMKT